MLFNICIDVDDGIYKSYMFFQVVKTYLAVFLRIILRKQAWSFLCKFLKTVKMGWLWEKSQTLSTGKLAFFFMQNIA